MNYYINEIFCDPDGHKTAGSKARIDASEIMNGMGIKKINIDSQVQINKNNIFMKIINSLNIYKKWRSSFSKLKKDDFVIIQFPMIDNTIVILNCLLSLERKGIKIIFLIHDWEFKRLAKDNRHSQWLKKILVNAYKLIVHNDSMKKVANDFGIQDKNIVTLGIFDYLIADYSLNKNNKNSLKFPIVIAGNLSAKKAGYLNKLPKGAEFNLYGIGYDEKNSASNVHYKGSFLPKELQKVMVGSFGLVWDGISADTCSGIFGEYLKINNPHKTSLYLSSGMPVIIWRNAALADFIKENQCGITIHSLNDIVSEINAMSESTYHMLCSNAEKIGQRLREGYYLKTAINKCLN